MRRRLRIALLLLVGLPALLLLLILIYLRFGDLSGYHVTVERLVSDGITVFLTSAYLDEAERCDRVGLMYAGRLIRCAPPARLKQEFRDGGYKVRRVGQSEEAQPDNPTLEDAFIAFVQERTEANG